MMYELEKLRNITFAEKVLRVMAFLRIGPNHPEGKAMKAKISEHLSDPEQGPEQLEPLFQEVTESFLPDYRCAHVLRESERNSECARLWGKLFISDCECGICRGANAVWAGIVDDAVVDKNEKGLQILFPSDATQEQRDAVINALYEQADMENCNANSTEEILDIEDTPEEKTVDESERITEEGPEWSDTEEDEGENTDT